MEKEFKIVIAADSFKGSASTIQVEDYIEQGILRLNRNVEIVKVPVADGGEGNGIPFGAGELSDIASIR